jgi:hypothetical protein
LIHADHRDSPLDQAPGAAQHDPLFNAYLSEVEAICDRALILMNGYVRADARLSELETTSDAILVLQDNVMNAGTALRGLEGACVT